MQGLVRGLECFKGSAAKAAFVLLIAIPITVSTTFAQENWELKRNSEGIKIYAKNVANSNIKALKADFIAKGTPELLANVLLDIDGYFDWAPSTKICKLVKRIDENEIIYYTEKKMPWPVTNRDAVLHIKVQPQAGTKPMQVTVVTIDNIVPAKKNIIRVPKSRITWVVTAVDNNNIRIQYEAQMDPGGSVPSWLVNSCADSGSFDTFRDLKEKMEEVAARLAIK